MQPLDGTPVLVTGAAGFIGSHLVERLLSEGAHVRAFLRYDSQNRLGRLTELPESDRARITIVRGDLKDPEAVRRAASGCEVVFHLGALIAIPFSYQNPTDYVQTNVVGTLHVLNACRDAGVRRLIQTSTSEVYGTARQVPITLSHPRQAQSPYAASKIAADALAESYARAYDLPVVILRPFNTYGPRQSPRAVIPTIVSQALKGETVRLGSIHPTRDFLYVSDTVSGFIAAATAPDLPPGIELQIGTGSESSVEDVVRSVADCLGKPLQIICEDHRVRPAGSEVERLLCDPGEARRRLNWSPTVTLKDGLRRVIDWMTKSPATPVDEAPVDVHSYIV
ncbi:MAG: SDR family NAD(P)-dependent oxidoreductase [candidate division Zixibacteria bacterium]|nr:SDR family NAD(P)-dependent oxidoreductase [candidate division Zixibacteria bacterium]